MLVHTCMRMCVNKYIFVYVYLYVRHTHTYIHKHIYTFALIKRDDYLRQAHVHCPRTHTRTCILHVKDFFNPK